MNNERRRCGAMRRRRRRRRHGALDSCDARTETRRAPVGPVALATVVTRYMYVRRSHLTQRRRRNAASFFLSWYDTAVVSGEARQFHSA